MIFNEQNITIEWYVFQGSLHDLPRNGESWHRIRYMVYTCNVMYDLVCCPVNEHCYFLGMGITFS